LAGDLGRGVLPEALGAGFQDWTMPSASSRTISYSVMLLIVSSTLRSASSCVRRSVRSRTTLRYPSPSGVTVTAAQKRSPSFRTRHPSVT